MDIENQETQKGSYTRGKVLKRAGIGAAAVWTVPFFASSASAGVDPAQSAARCSGTDPNTGLLSPVCEFQVCATKRGKDCFCYPGAKGSGTSSGCCVCAGNTFCTQSPPCNVNGDCPRGWKCTFNGCGQTCVPPCGQGLSSGAAQGAKTTAG